MGIHISKNGEGPPPRKCNRKVYRRLNQYNRPINSKAFIWKNAWILVKITNVYDGDTITALYLDKYKQEVTFSIRLMDIDAAEMPRRKDKSDVGEYELKMAEASKQRVVELCSNRICWLRIWKFDKYGGRLLGWVYPCLGRKTVSPNSISETLLTEGLVVEYHGDRKGNVDWRRMWEDL